MSDLETELLSNLDLYGEIGKKNVGREGEFDHFTYSIDFHLFSFGLTSLWKALSGPQASFLHNTSRVGKCDL